MNLLETMARSGLLWLVAASWQVTIVICIVAVLAWLARGASPGLRYGLWLLVLLKLFLPPALSAPWSLGRWTGEPLDWLASDLIQPGPAASADNPIAGARSLAAETISLQANSYSRQRLAGVVVAIWGLGFLLFWLAVGRRYRELTCLIRSAAQIDEGPIRVEYESLVLLLGLNRAPDLYAADQVSGPFLCGLVRPCIVLPQAWLSDIATTKLRAMLAHELMHYRRHDTWIGWLQVIGQSLFWFHPLVWWAGRELRHARECVCDEGVMRLEVISPQEYAESIVHAVTASRGRSLVAGSLVGISERGGKLQDRLEEIMNFRASRHAFNWLGRGAIAALAALLLPLGGASISRAALEGGAPKLIQTVPENGSRNVDPGVAEISVTFDRDMRGGMSWTGDGPEFPPLDDSRKAEWRDKRTCVLPVKLAAGAFYRVGINSTSFQNFKSAEGVAADPVVIAFTTKGATAEAQEQLRAPKIVKLEPKKDAMDVDPNTTELKVTFDVPMDAGMSWTGGGEQFPKLPEGKKASWSADGLTCTLPVKLEPGHDYQVGLNSPRFKNFQSKAGVPLEPVVYKFRTRSK